MSEWHPILAAVEYAPGRWVMRDPFEREYGRIELRRVGTEVRYRVERNGELLGWGMTLRTSAMRLHEVYLRAMGPDVRGADG